MRKFSFLVALAVLVPASLAHAGGFFLAERGVRPLGRGGAFVAGADDLHSLWINPAGLSWSGSSLLLDANLTLFSVDYTRIDSGGNVLPTVNGYHPYLPIPTLGGTFHFPELPDWSFGAALMVPNAALPEWPRSVVDQSGVEQPAPQRYSVLSMQGSFLATIALGAAWRPIPELSIGFAAHFLFGSFTAESTVSACDGVACAFPEDPEYDGVALVSLPVFYPIFVFGATYDAGIVRIGASFSTPFDLAGSAAIQMRPPSAAAFSGAELVNRGPGCDYTNPNDPCRNNTRADVSLGFPFSLRGGVEVRPVPELRIEASVVWEAWSMQQEVQIVPRDVWIEGALGFLDYQVGPLTIPRRMNDTVSVRLGGEYTIERVVTVRLGGSFENGAFSNPYLNALTIDSDKLIFAAGVGVNVSDEVRIDAVGGYVGLFDRSVRDSQVPQPSPIRPPLTPSDPRQAGDPVFIGDGDYHVTAPFFGLGLHWRMDPPRPSASSQEPEQEAAPEGPPQEQAPSAAPAEGATDPGRPWYLQGGQAPPEQAAPAEEAAPEASPEPEPEQPRRRPRRRRR